jgi:hypothetical protein
MYYVKPLFFKKKHYYEKEAEICNKAIKDLCILLDGTSTDIKNQLDKFKKPSIFTNQINDCSCSIFIKCIDKLVDKITDLENKICNKNFSLVKAFDTSIKSVLSPRYVHYIKKYGVPDDGIFLEELLSEFT